MFALLADLRDYDRWLPRSRAYNGTTEIGKVTALCRPTRLDFEQPVTSWLSALGVIDIRLSHTLTPGAGFVHVLRVLQLSPRGPVKFAMPVVVPMFRADNGRLIEHLKEFAEKEAPPV